MLEHPDHAKAPIELAIILAGPSVYLLGTALFKWITNDRRAPPLSHLVGLALLALLAWPLRMHWLSPLHLALATNGALLVVALWESLALRRVMGTEVVFDDE